MDFPWKIIGIAFILLFVGSVLFGLAGGYSQVSGGGYFSRSASVNQTAGNAIAYINKNLLSEGESITLNGVTEESGVYRVSTHYTYSGGQKDIDAYITRDGKYLFPEYYTISSSSAATGSAGTATAAQRTPKATCDDIGKSAAPVLEAYVVSYCPYGTQMQRVLAEIVSAAPELTRHITVRYIGSVQDGSLISMHGDTEAKENLRQMCIREEQPDRYWEYVSCFISSTDAAACEKSAGVDSTSLNGCTGDTTRGLKYAAADSVRSEKFFISGSPTLVLNDAVVSEFDFGGRNAESVKNLLCCGFTTKPGSCSQTLSSDQASAGSGGQC